MSYPLFNLRVYGIFINPDQELLITDEFRLGMLMTKFPGGGLQFGEGTIDCLKREFKEELNLEITNIRHFYTTDFFQPTIGLNEQMQLINIYYAIDIPDWKSIKTTQKSFDFPDKNDGVQCFRWIKLTELTPGIFTFPIDQKAAKIIRDQWD
jgi:8-oxo-dGTP diphosphatase